MSVTPASNPTPSTDAGHREGFLAVTWLFFSVASIFLAARLAVRILRRNVGIDDWCMLAGWVLHIPCTVLITLQVNLGALHLEPTTPPATILLIATYLKADICLFLIGVSLCKCSVGLLLLRLLDKTSKWRRTFIWVNMAVLIGLSVVTLVVTLVNRCPAVGQYSRAARTEGVCLRPEIPASLMLAQSAFGSYVDVAFALLPLTFVAKLALSLRKRIAICCLLGLGTVTGVFGSLKTYQLSLVSTSAAAGGFEFALYSVLEAFSVIALGCISVCYPIYTWLVTGERIRPEASSSSSASAQNRLEMARLRSASGVTVEKQASIRTTTTTTTTIGAASARSMSDLSMAPSDLRSEQGYRDGRSIYSDYSYRY